MTNAVRALSPIARNNPTLSGALLAAKKTEARGESRMRQRVQNPHAETFRIWELQKKSRVPRLESPHSTAWKKERKSYQEKRKPGG